MKKLLLLLILLFSTACVTTRTVEVPVETIKTEYIHEVKRDSIVIRDSVDRFVKGDSVIIYKEKVIYKYVFNTDTVVNTDSIPKPIYIETIQEVNKLLWYQESLMYLGLLALIIIAIKILNVLK